jgi:uncharacterized protein (TIGR00725 family)
MSAASHEGDVGRDESGRSPGQDLQTGALPVLAVLGPGASVPELETVAEAVGGIAARAGWAVLTGGGSGVMAAACRGAAARGGLTVGVLPVERPTADYPNPWVRLSVFTGAGHARNAFNVLSAELCLALGGGPGTLSEVALALKTGREIWTYRSWTLEPPPGASVSPPRSFDEPESLLDALRLRLAAPVGRRSR